MNLYLCDHEKNTECKKRACLFEDDVVYPQCCLTTNRMFAKLDRNGRPMMVVPEEPVTVDDVKKEGDPE